MVDQGVSGEGEEPGQKGNLLPVLVPFSMQFCENRLKNIFRLAPVLQSGHQKPEDPAFVPPIQDLKSLQVAIDIGQH
jgi:hypothetical protein